MALLLVEQAGLGKKVSVSKSKEKGNATLSSSSSRSSRDHTSHSSMWDLFLFELERLSCQGPG